VNENTNLRIKALLEELAQDPTTEGSVRAFSPSHQELLKLYEEGVFESQEKIDPEIERIRKNPRPSSQDITKYKLWLEQGYLSPYTGRLIPLSRLFTTDYQVEHIIPKSRYFDDSLSNKVICEASVNALKDNATAFEFMEKSGRSIVNLGFGQSAQLFSLEEFQVHCKRFFRKNRSKLNKLLSKEVPDDFINRQLNDTRYISKFIMGLLSNIIRVEGEVTHRSKNLVPVTGAITSELKKDWGLNDIWNDLVSPRFKRLNELTGSSDFGYVDKQINAFRIQVPQYLERGFNKKRIDHRHHALDALVIACTSGEHVNYLNSLNSARENHALIRKLRKTETIDYVNKATGEVKTRIVAKEFLKPWPTFTQEAKGRLETVIISFKSKNRVINKTTNKYWSFTDEKGNPYFDKNGQPVQRLTRQVNGESWAIRQSLHQESISGRVTIRRKAAKPVALKTAVQRWEDIADPKVRKIVRKTYEKLNGDRDKTVEYFKKNGLYIDEVKIESLPMYEHLVATARRVPLTSDFTRKQLEAITDSGIQLILENHLKKYTNERGVEDFEAAFGDVGLVDLNLNISALNNGKFHQPIRNVRVYEVSQKFPVGTSPDSMHKYVETAKGTNLYFAIYWNEKLGKRSFETVPLNEVIEHQKQTAHLPQSERTPIPVNPEKGQFLFALSPGDLVYVPTDEEWETKTLPSFNELRPEVARRICVMEKASGNRCYFQFHSLAGLIAPYDPKTSVAEFGSQNKFEKFDDGMGIKENCVKLRVSPLGLVSSITQY
jgi:CRISPR-associated endonuclease Csn1